MGPVIRKEGLTCLRKLVGRWGKEGGRPRVVFQKHQPVQLLPGAVWQSFGSAWGRNSRLGCCTALEGCGEAAVSHLRMVWSHTGVFGCILETELSARQAATVLSPAVPTQISLA